MAQHNNASDETLETLINRSRSVEITVTESVEVTHKRGTAPRDQNKVARDKKVAATFTVEDGARLALDDALLLTPEMEADVIDSATARMDELRAHQPDAEADE